MFRKRPIQQTPQRQSLIEIETTGPHTAVVHTYDRWGKPFADAHLGQGEAVRIANPQDGEDLYIRLGEPLVPPIPRGYYRVPRWVAWLCGVTE